jgi:hypothetical protein
LSLPLNLKGKKKKKNPALLFEFLDELCKEENVCVSKRSCLLEH